MQFLIHSSPAALWAALNQNPKKRGVPGFQIERFEFLDIKQDLKGLKVLIIVFMRLFYANQP